MPLDHLLPDVTVLVCTYNRPAELRDTVQALKLNLEYPQDKLHWLICDDRSPVDWDALLQRDFYAEALRGIPFIQTRHERSGWGANVNNGLDHVATPYVFFIEDDYVLRQTLDLRTGIALMETEPRIGYVRYRGIAGDTKVDLRMQETDVSALLPEYRSGMGLPGKLPWFWINWNSSSLWLYTHGAHLKHMHFHSYYGYYADHLPLGATEEAFCHTVKDGLRASPSAPQLAILPDWIEMHFDHVGQSYQHTELDRVQR